MIGKKSLVVLVVLLLTPSLSYAATDSALLKQEIMQQRKELKNTIQASRAATLQTIKENRDELKIHIQEMRDNFKMKLQELKDEKKKMVVEKIDTRLSTTNTNLTNRWNEVISKLKTVVSKITEKSSMLKTSGKDTTALDAALTKASAAITAAENAVKTQSGKDYTPTIVSETTLKNTIGTTVSQFRLDIQTTFKAVNDARLAVILAEKELKKLMPNKTTEATISATITPASNSGTLSQ